jgi:hypothetical protein
MGNLSYRGVVREGKIELANDVHLPEGSEVIVLPGASLDERQARRIANGWLLNHVGNLVGAKNGQLIEIEGALLWRFDAMATSLYHDPVGPIGKVTIDAMDGAVLNTPESAEQMIINAGNLKRPAPTPDR